MKWAQETLIDIYGFILLSISTTTVNAFHLEKNRQCYNSILSMVGQHCSFILAIKM